MKIFFLWTERSHILRNVSLRVAKGAFQLSSATLWEKDDRSKFNFLWLVYDFECFFHCYTKVSQGVLKPQTKCAKEKFFWEFFCRECSFKHFRCLSRGTWKFSSISLAGFSKLHSICPEEHFHSNILEASL